MFLQQLQQPKKFPNLLIRISKCETISDCLWPRMMSRKWTTAPLTCFMHARHRSPNIVHRTEKVNTLIFIAVLRFSHFSLGSAGLNVWHLLLGDDTLTLSNSPRRICAKRKTKQLSITTHSRSQLNDDNRREIMLWWLISGLEWQNYCNFLDIQRKSGAERDSWYFQGFWPDKFKKGKKWGRENLREKRGRESRFPPSLSPLRDFLSPNRYICTPPLRPGSNAELFMSRT